MLVAWDTETTLIPDRQKIPSKSGGEIAVSPYVTPTLILGSYATDAGERGVVSASELVKRLEGWLKTPDVHLIAQNVAFDFDVVVTYAPYLLDLFIQAADEGRIHDTMYYDLLARIADGVFDKPIVTETGEVSFVQSGTRSLDQLAIRYCGMTLDKDPNIRLHFGQFKDVDIEDLPPTFRNYALQDAVATLRVWQAIKERAHGKDLGEPAQVRAALAVAALDKRGVAIDRDMAAQLEARFLADAAPLEVNLVKAGLGRFENAETLNKTEHPGAVTGVCLEPGVWHYDPTAHIVRKFRYFKRHWTEEVGRPEFHLNTAAVQLALRPYIDPRADDVPTRADGSLSLDAEYWAERLPPEAGPLLDWLRYEKLKKVLTTYLCTYSRSNEIFPRWHVLGARSGRMAAKRPNLQNVPKRKAGIRALFVPHDGYLFVKADYSAQEMFTLAETMLNLGIDGPLANFLRSGGDIHRAGAALVLKKAPEEVTKAERQAQKALHFGVPGGLGPRRLASYAYAGYGVKWTIDQAREARDAFLTAYWDVRQYLQRIQRDQHEALLMAATGYDEEGWRDRIHNRKCGTVDIVRYEAFRDRQFKVALPTGRVRSYCRFTEAANTYFQGLASDVTKQACWLCFKAGLRVVMVVHDEIIVEARPEAVRRVADTLLSCMLEAFRQVCPRIGKYARADIEPGLERWGAATDLEGKALTL